MDPGEINKNLVQSTILHQIRPKKHGNVVCAFIFLPYLFKALCNIKYRTAKDI
jgi:hypothetical protein